MTAFIPIRHLPHAAPNSQVRLVTDRSTPLLVRTANLCLVVLGACTGVETAGTVTQRDSAGVQISENTDAAWSQSSKWVIDTVPMVRLGGPATDPPLFRVRGALRLTTGQIVVADGGSSEVRYYAANGQPLVTTGGPGEGPGNFVRIGQLLRTSLDSLIVYDAALRRITTLSPTGDVVGTESLPDEVGSNPSIAGVFTDGALLIRIFESRLDQGRFRIPVTLAALSDCGTDSLGVDVGWTAVAFQVDGRPFLLTAPFGTFGYTVVSGDEYYTLRTDRYEVRRFNRGGELEAIMRRSVSSQPITAADLDAELERHLDRYEAKGPVRSAVFDALRGMPMPGTMPAVGSLHESRAAIEVDAQGNVWVRDYTPPGQSEARWSVFERGGAYLGTVDMISGLEPTDIGTDYILGVRTDAHGVEYVQLHRLIKP